MISFSRKRIILFICSLAYFIASLDTTIVNVALPAIAKDYSITLISTRNIPIVFNFVYGISIPIGCYLSDKFGVKIIFILAALLFGLSSLLCGFSSNLLTLEILRGLQGLSAAFFTPVARSIVIKYSSKETIVNNMANVFTIGLLAQTIGPFAGGMITAHLSWKWVFLINIPICMLVIVLGYIYLKNIKEEKTGGFDYFAFASITIALTSFLFICDYIADWDIEAVKIFIAIVLCFGAAYVYYKYSKKKPLNIINTKLFKDKIFRSSILISIAVRQGLSGMTFVYVMILSLVYGFKAEQIGNIILFFGLGVWTSKFLIPILNKYIKIQKLIYWSAVSIFCCVLAIAFLVHFKSSVLFIIVLTICGASASLFYGYLNGMPLQRIEKSDSSHASTIMSLVINVSQSSSISIFNIFFMSAGIMTAVTANKIFVSVIIMSLIIFSAILMMKFNKDFMNYEEPK
ncbi:MAG TPA: hypothetical protein DD381_12370 [Lentisphaeria bacterium]|nr:MAG: hypothetical protein A2X47_09370 [Lentisphaerae bacterium GWF2_38_69]HBM17121.1 hypothetical protein [Lentisphaeria bacterium]